MPEIRPLAAIRYSSRLHGGPEHLICPPYDVIGPALQAQLYGQSPYNAVRLELPLEDDPYRAAAERLDEWLREGVLERDSAPAFYALQQEFEGPDGVRRIRTGFFAALRLSDPGEKKVLPHEKTLAGPRKDRLSLFRETRANISPVFGLYADPSGNGDRMLRNFCAEHPAVFEAEFQGVDNRMWRIDEPAMVFSLASLLDGRTVYIADGHHRFATGLDYRNERALADPCHTGDEPWNFILAFLANIHDDGLAIFPIHRLVAGLEGFSPALFRQGLDAWFEVRELADTASIAPFLDSCLSVHAYGVIMQGAVLGISLREGMDPGLSVPDALASLDVVLLHELVLSRMLGIGEDALAGQLHVRYVKDWRELGSAVGEGSAQIGFQLRPATVAQVRDVAEAGLVMPQKSTFFYPKIMTGLLFNPLD